MRTHIKDCEGEKKRTLQLTHTILRDLDRKTQELHETEHSIQEVERDMRLQESEYQKVISQVDERKYALERAKSTHADVESILLGLKDHISKLKEEQEEVRAVLRDIANEVNVQEENKSELVKEYQMLQDHLRKFEAEHQTTQGEYLRAI